MHVTKIRSYENISSFRDLVYVWFLEIFSSSRLDFLCRVKESISEDLDDVSWILSCSVSHRSYSTEGCVDTKTAKRKYSASDKGAGPSKTPIVEPPDSDDENNSKNNTSPRFDTDENGYVHVYTDGACENNGRVGARAGIGVWFADNHPLWVVPL